MCSAFSKQYSLFVLPCLANYDYAYRNILLDPCTYRAKLEAFIDWDDVHVMPFALDFTEDIEFFGVDGLSLNSNYHHEGRFAF